MRGGSSDVHLLGGISTAHADYHWNGVQTTVKRRGGDASIEGGNPAVDHTSTPEFIVGRVLAKNESVEWIEIGWAEVSWRADGPELYTFNDASGVWSFPSGYPLTPGEFVLERVHDCDGDGTCANIYWDGAYNRVAKVTHVKCRNAAGQNNCYIENFLEIYSEQSGSPHSDIGQKAFRDGDVKNNAGNWVTWDETVSSSTSELSPYNVCWLDNYWRFDAGKQITC